MLKRFARRSDAPDLTTPDLANAVCGFLQDDDRAVFVYAGETYLYPENAEEQLAALPQAVRAVIELPLRALLSNGIGFVRCVCANERFYTLQGKTSGECAALIVRHEPLPDGAAAVFDASGKLLLKTPAFDALWRLDGEMIADYDGLLTVLTSKRLLSPDEARTQRKHRAGLLGTTFAVQTDTCTLPDGRTVSGRFMPRAGGGAVWVCEDLSAGIDAERELHAVRSGRRTLLDALDQGVAVFGSDGAVRLENAAFRTLTGVNEGASVHAALAHWQRADEKFAQAVRTLITGDGARRRLQKTLHFHDQCVQRVDAVPLPDGTVLISTADRTAEHLAAKALRDRLAPLRRAQRYNENLAYALRTPLHSVTGFAQLLLLLKPEASPAHQDALAALQNGIDELSQQIELLLQVLHTEGLPAAACRDIDVAELLRDAAARFTGNIVIECDIETIEGDPGLLHAALDQLLDNAVKYTPSDERIVLAAHGAGHRVLLSVRDQGRGLFADPSARRRGDGAGLGLTLVQKVCELHGGEFQLSPLEGGGTYACMLLPEQRT